MKWYSILVFALAGCLLYALWTAKSGRDCRPDYRQRDSMAVNCK